MPNRIIKESICTSERIDQVGDAAECLFYRLLVNCDDYGLLDARLAILKGKCYPLKSIDGKRIQALLRSLQEAGLVHLYEVDGKPYLRLNKWEKHQQIRAQRAKYPFPADGLDSGCEQLKSSDSGCSPNPIQSKSNQSNQESNPNQSAPPPPEVVAVPDSIDAEAWQSFVTHRKQLKKTLTPLAAKKQIEFLSGYDKKTQRTIIDQTIRNGWAGLFEPKGGNTSAKPDPEQERVRNLQRSASGRVQLNIEREQQQQAAAERGCTNTLDHDDQNLRPQMDVSVR